jgi:uncharacterized protein (TIGR03118 family)
MVSINALVVDIPHGPNPPHGPTGQVSNNAGAGTFLVNGTAASFIFASLDGSISAWNGSAMTTAQVKVPAQMGRGYTGLTIGGTGANGRLYAATPGGNAVDVYDSTFTKVNLSASAFKDPVATAAGLAPFNVKNINGQFYVAYASPVRDPGRIHAPEGSGAIGVFDADGNLIRHFTDGGKLAAPWGFALAPSSFGPFGGDLLIGNFSYEHSTINAFNPVTGMYVGTLTDLAGNPIANPGLWEIIFGNGGNGGRPDTLYFAAGIESETHGLFGAIQFIPEPSTLTLTALGGLMLCGMGCWRLRKRA